MDQSNLETHIKPAEEFIDEFCEKMDTLRKHDFIAKQQSLYLTQRKESLVEGEYVVIGDFSENYSFVSLDS